MMWRTAVADRLWRIVCELPTSLGAIAWRVLEPGAADWESQDICPWYELKVVHKWEVRYNAASLFWEFGC
jgi:hypothetical protein